MTAWSYYLITYSWKQIQYSFGEGFPSFPNFNNPCFESRIFILLPIIWDMGPKRSILVFNLWGNASKPSSRDWKFESRSSTRLLLLLSGNCSRISAQSCTDGDINPIIDSYKLFETKKASILLRTCSRLVGPKLHFEIFLLRQFLDWY